MKTSILGDNFANYYLQAGEYEEDEMDLEAHLRESTQHKVPSDFKEFFSMLTSCGEDPHDEDFYILGMWNGNIDFLSASEGDQINSLSVTINLSASNRGSIFHSYKANVDFCFLAGNKNEYKSKKFIAENIIQISISSLPFKYATFVNREYISYYDSIPDIIIGGSLYCIKSELDTVQGFRRHVSEDIEEISPIQGYFDIHNPEHIQKAHNFEEELLRNHQFRQLLLR